MPIIQHPACIAPAPDTSICRFMDFNKFRDLFANEELYFRRTDLFKETDPSEALPSDEYVRAACGLRKYDLDDEHCRSARSSVLLEGGSVSVLVSVGIRSACVLMLVHAAPNP